MTEDTLLEQFKQLAELTPEDELVHYGLGGEYMKRGLYREAVACFEKVIALKPDYSAAYRELGRALEKAEDIDAAIRIYNKGKEVASSRGDGQTVKEIDVFLNRMMKRKQP